MPVGVDASVGIRQDDTPDRQIDNALLTTGSGSVFRQRVQDLEQIELLEEIRSALEQLATETTLATVLTEATFSAEDFATQATLEAARVLLAAIDADTSNLDVALSTRATEGTVATLLTEATFTAADFLTEATFTAADFASEATLEAARVLLATIAGLDFATEGTLTALLTESVWTARVGEVATSPTANTILARLKDINDSLGSLSVTADFVGDEADLDSDAGTDSHEVIAIGLPGSGGHVVGGTVANPIRTDPTGTSTQPVSGPVTDAELRATPVKVDDDATQTLLGTLQADQDLATAAIQSTQQSRLDLLATETTAADGVLRLQRLDYDGRTDDKPVYFGRAVVGTAAASAVWMIFRFTYDVDDRVEIIDRREDVAWDNRADPTIDGQPAWSV